jgi:hypothetical protein
MFHSSNGQDHFWVLLHYLLFSHLHSCIFLKRLHPALFLVTCQTIQFLSPLRCGINIHTCPTHMYVRVHSLLHSLQSFGVTALLHESGPPLSLMCGMCQKLGNQPVPHTNSAILRLSPQACYNRLSECTQRVDRRFLIIHSGTLSLSPKEVTISSTASSHQRSVHSSSSSHTDRLYFFKKGYT